MSIARIIAGSIIALLGLYICIMNWRILMRRTSLSILPFAGAFVLLCSMWVTGVMPAFGRYVWVPLLVDGGAIPFVLSRIWIPSKK